MHISPHPPADQYKQGVVYVESTGYPDGDGTVGTAVTESFRDSASLVRHITKLVEAHNEVWPDKRINITAAIQS